MPPKDTVEMDSLENGKNIDLKDKEEGRQKLFGVRHIQTLLNFFLIFIAYGLRTNLSVAIVAMTDPTTSPNPDIPTYPEWQGKSIILSSFFWGYLPPQAIAGQLAKKYGAKWFLVSAMILCGIFTLLLPQFAAMWGSNGIMLCRIMQGMGQGFIFPMTHHAISKWIPSCERSRIGTFVYTGGTLGTVVSLITSGLISASWLGWPAVFYIYGCITLLWTVAMAILGFNSPTEHPYISKEEKAFIEEDIGSSHEIPTPWKKIFTSLPLWAILVAHCGQNWGFWTLMTEMPLYLSNIMKLDLKSNSLTSALPYLTLWLLSFVFGGMADCFINKKLFSVGVTRKIFTGIGLIAPGLALVCLGFLNAEQKIFAICLLILAVGLNSAIYCGFHVNHIDIAPNHSGILMGITNGASNIFSLIAPLIVQVIVTDEQDPLQWRTIFFLVATVYITTCTFYLIYGKGKLQSWNEEPPKSDNSKTQTKGK